MKAVLLSLLSCMLWGYVLPVMISFEEGDARSAPVAAPTAEPGGREEVAALVKQVQKADFEADLPALRRLYERLEPYTADPDFGSRVRYWRGFALWRRAMNAMNDPKSDREETKRDLNGALAEFTRAFEADSGFADAKIAAFGCMANLRYLQMTAQPPENPDQEMMNRAMALAREAATAAPNNPRVLWLRGGSLWWAPADRGGSQTKAMETYDRGLAEARKQTITDPLEPSWGEAELLMTLAWANLNRAEPDLDAAERYARAALQIAPNWHYVRDILMAQIRAARAKAAK